MGIEVEDRPFAKSMLQVFRAQLILHDKVREVFESSLRLARESGYLKKRSMKVALDTTNILGRGAVKDTCNLLADGIVRLIRALAQLKGINVGQWAKSQGYLSRAAVYDQRDAIFGLSSATISRRVTNACQFAGAGGGFSGHSGRVGMAVDLATAETGAPALMKAGRWDSPAMPLKYIRNEEAARGAVARYHQPRSGQFGIREPL